MAQTRLASLLVGILCQTLVPRVDGKGRVPAVEVLLANAAVRNLIREGKIHQIQNVMLTHSQEGMMLLDHALQNLLVQGKITRESALALMNETKKLTDDETSKNASR